MERKNAPKLSAVISARATTSVSETSPSRRSRTKSSTRWICALSAFGMLMAPGPKKVRAGSARFGKDGPTLGPEDGVDLRFQRLRVERLDDVVVDPRLLGRDDVLRLGLGGHHDERRRAEMVVGADLLKELVAGHRLHVPIGDHEAVLLLLQLAESGRAVRRVVDIVEAELLEKVSNDADHRLVVVDHQDRHRKVHCHHPAPAWHDRSVPQRTRLSHWGSRSGRICRPQRPPPVGTLVAALEYRVNERLSERRRCAWLRLDG